jgi:hypothetical protein
MFFYIEKVDLKQIFHFITHNVNVDKDFSIIDACNTLGIKVEDSRKDELFYQVELLKTLHDKLSRYINGDIE